MTPEELQVPPTEIELAELQLAATRPDHQLTRAGVDILRRLMFAYNRLAPVAHEHLMQTDDVAYYQRHMTPRIAELTAYAKERERAGADAGPTWDEIRRLQRGGRP